MPVINPCPKAVAKQAVEAFEARCAEHRIEGRRMAKLGSKKIKLRRIAGALAFMFGASIGIYADRAHAAEITDTQAAIIGRIAVDAVAYQKCGFPQPTDMFAGMEKSGLTIQSLTYSGGAHNPVMVRVLDAVWASYKDHPAEFCTSVASTRAR